MCHNEMIQIDSSSPASPKLWCCLIHRSATCKFSAYSSHFNPRKNWIRIIPHVIHMLFVGSRILLDCQAGYGSVAAGLREVPREPRFEVQGLPHRTQHQGVGAETQHFGRILWVSTSKMPKHEKRSHSPKVYKVYHLEICHFPLSG